MLPSALPDVIRCATGGCLCTQANLGRFADTDGDTVEVLRRAGWQVNGEWLCPSHLAEDRRALPGAAGRNPNPYCSKCGDTRGGAYGHNESECTWSPS